MRKRRSLPSGFTLIELLVALTLIGILAAIASPPLARMRGRSALQSGRAMVTSALATARASSTRWGRNSVVWLDDDDVIRVIVDTGSTGTGVAPKLVSTYQLGTDLGLRMSADRDALCFNSRGVGTTAAACPASGARILLTHGSDVDTLNVNMAGRLWQ
jgi:prepilin-type N-terminal cleavage/methylation domain-containing protein